MPRIKNWRKSTTDFLKGLWVDFWINNISLHSVAIKEYYDGWKVIIFRKNNVREILFSSKDKAYKYVIDWMKKHPKG